MKRKITAICVVVAMLAVAIIGGTMAYFTDTESAVNVMTMGNVKIEQQEWQRAENVPHKNSSSGATEGQLVEYENFQPIMPAVPKNGLATDYTAEATDLFYWGVYAPGGNGLWDDEKLSNVIDKIIMVKNIGKSNAYYRTVIAIECPEGISIDEPANGAEIMINVNGSPKFEWTECGYITYEGVRYAIIVANYLEILKPNEVSRPSLLQVVLTHNATNEDAELFGDTFDIVAISQAVQAAGFEGYDPQSDAVVALDTAFGRIDLSKDSGAGQGIAGKKEVSEWIFDAYEPLVYPWDGTADTTWYNETDTEFVLSTAEQLAGLAKMVDEGNTFEGKTVKLAKDIDLYVKGENGEAVCFDPIGSYRNDTPFKGTFDGQGHTISNLSQNTWALNNGYYYGDLGLGLFGLVEDATVKNLVMDGASISGESAICGTVAATAYGDCVFENITVKNSKCNDYQYYAGGVVGWASGNHQYTNISVEASTTIGSQWGDFGNANGGVIGGIGSSAEINMKDCTIACRIDAVNDVVSAYQWYNYRNSGMLIGRVPQTITNGEVQTVKTPEKVTCENVKVIYGDWANYHYCEFAGTGYPFVRVEAGVSVDAYSNVRYGHPTDANGNTVVDDNHVHNDGEKHNELIAFDQLFGGPAEHRYCYYGISEFDGVTVIYNNK